MKIKAVRKLGRATYWKKELTVNAVWLVLIALFAFVWRLF